MITSEVIGWVSNVNDPEKRGRVMATSPTAIESGIELPDWIEPGFDNGAFYPAEVKELIVVKCNETDPSAPWLPGEGAIIAPWWRWYPAGYTKEKGQKPLHARFREDYPNVRGYISRREHGLLYGDNKDLKKQFVSLFHRSGSKVHLGHDGSVDVQTSGGMKLSLNLTTMVVRLDQGQGVFVELRPGSAMISAPLLLLAAAQVCVGTGADSPEQGGAKIVRFTELAELMDKVLHDLKNHDHDAGLLQAPPGGGPVTGTSGQANVSGDLPAVTPADIGSTSTVGR